MIMETVKEGKEECKEEIKGSRTRKDKERRKAEKRQEKESQTKEGNFSSLSESCYTFRGRSLKHGKRILFTQARPHVAEI